MAFRVEIAPQAFDDLDSIATYIRDHSTFAVAEKWFNGIIDDIASLKEMPARCRVAPESEDIGQEVRLLLHGRRNRSYKIYYAIDYETPSTGTVRVFHVRHWARKPVSEDEISWTTFPATATFHSFAGKASHFGCSSGTEGTRHRLMRPSNAPRSLAGSSYPAGAR